MVSIFSFQYSHVALCTTYSFTALLGPSALWQFTQMGTGQHAPMLRARITVDLVAIDAGHRRSIVQHVSHACVHVPIPSFSSGLSASFGSNRNSLNTLSPA